MCVGCGETQVYLSAFQIDGFKDNCPITIMCTWEAAESFSIHFFLKVTVKLLVFRITKLKVVFFPKQFVYTSN